MLLSLTNAHTRTYLYNTTSIVIFCLVHLNCTDVSILLRDGVIHTTNDTPRTRTASDLVANELFRCREWQPLTTLLFGGLSLFRHGTNVIETAPQ
jgi:hypothetical protein